MVSFWDLDKVAHSEEAVVRQDTASLSVLSNCLGKCKGLWNRDDAASM